jgi:hypothetical protein
MNNNVVSLPFDEIEEVDGAMIRTSERAAVNEFVIDNIIPWCEQKGIDISTEEFKHQAAVIVTQLQIILMGKKAN